MSEQHDGWEDIEVELERIGPTSLAAHLDPTRPHDGQPHTDHGERGRTEVKGITFRDLRDCFIRACYESSGMPIEQWPGSVHDLPWDDMSIIAVAQNLSCNVEKAMGIYPNIERRYPVDPTELHWCGPNIDVAIYRAHDGHCAATPDADEASGIIYIDAPLPSTVLNEAYRMHDDWLRTHALASTDASGAQGELREAVDALSDARGAVLYAMSLLRTTNLSDAALAEVERIEREWNAARPSADGWACVRCGDAPHDCGEPECGPRIGGCDRGPCSLGQGHDGRCDR